MGLRNFLLNAFRELIVHHHSSLEFRAKLFALVVAVDSQATEEVYERIKEVALSTYKNDEDRAHILVMSTKEYVKRVREEHGSHIDALITNIQSELKLMPRYAKKIDISSLEKVLEFTKNEDTLLYQKNIIEFLEKLKEEILHTKKNQITQDEQGFHSKYSS
ncbi:MAG: hypothetical protein RBR59_09700 [Sulfurimonadaceae bacterium]|nr:hypothetical protein [Sulfurimonadaceae bacterium]